MDPNANLEELRELAQNTLADDSADDLPEKAAHLAELFVALDEWLTKGGFLPQAWERKP